MQSGEDSMTTDDPPAVASGQSAGEEAASEAVTIDAGFVAPLLGLAPDAFMAAIRRGAVVQRTERGVDEDAGHYRVTFRYRRRRCRLIVSADTGAVLQA
jgi:hypothetical protein